MCTMPFCSYRGFWVLVGAFLCVIDPVMINYSGWMNHLSEEARLTHLNIPGTHESSSSVFPKVTFATSVDEQLLKGIRFFDIRLQVVCNETLLVAQRSVDMFPRVVDTTFSKVQDEFTNFLRNNPRELILVRLKEAGEPLTNLTTEAVLQANMKGMNDFYCLGGNTVKACRGKIYVFYDYPSLDSPFYPQMLVTVFKNPQIQDYRLDEPYTMNSFVVAYFSSWIGDVHWLRTDVDSQIHSWIHEWNSPSIGIVAMDFPSQALILSIISLNFSGPIKRCGFNFYGTLMVLLMVKNFFRRKKKNYIRFSLIAVIHYRIITHQHPLLYYPAWYLVADEVLFLFYLFYYDFSGGEIHHECSYWVFMLRVVLAIVMFETMWWYIPLLSAIVHSLDFYIKDTKVVGKKKIVP